MIQSSCFCKEKRIYSPSKSGEPQHKFSDLDKHFKLEKKFEIGDRYVCSICSRVWFRSNEFEIFYKVPIQMEELLDEWISTDIVLSNQKLLTLRSIGSLRPTRSLVGALMVPCQVTDLSGNIYTKSVVFFCHGKTYPLFQFGSQKLQFANRISKIEPSDYSLPFKVRLACSQAFEVIRGFEPTSVIDNDGKRFTINGRANFFDLNGTKGNEIKLDHSQRTSRAPIFNDDWNNPSYFLADYHEAFQFLCL